MSKEAAFFGSYLPELHQLQNDVSRSTSWTQQDDFINSIRFNDQIVSFQFQSSYVFYSC